MPFSFKKKNQPPEKGRYAEVKIRSARRYIPRWRWYIIILVIAAPLIYFLYEILDENVVAHAGGHVTFDSTIVRSPERGYVYKVFVKIGDEVKKSQILIVFKSPEAVIELRHMRKELKTLVRLRAQFIDDETAEFARIRATAVKNLLESQKHYKKMLDFQKRGTVSVVLLDDARRKVSEAKLKVEEIDKEAVRTKNAYAKELEKNYDRRIREVKSKIVKLEKIDEFYNLKAPESGTVTNLFTYPGEFLSGGQPLLQLATKANLRIRAFLAPKFISYAVYKKKVTIVFPDRKRIKGLIINQPSFAQQLPGSSREPLLKKDNQIVIIIRPLEPIPSKYQIHGVPVRINF